MKELKNVKNDTDVTVEYVRYLTTLASAQERENRQSLLLADGQFKEGDELLVTPIEEGAYASLEGITEDYRLVLPEDGNTEHQFCYQAPEGQTEGVTIYVKTQDGWQEAETTQMGMYDLFLAEGTDTEIAVRIEEAGIERYLPLFAGGIAAAGLVIFVIVKKKKSAGKKKATAEKEQIPE